MNVYILDWSGTLDQLANPKGFVRALQFLGHKVVLWTGHMILRHPAALAVDRFATKTITLRELVLESIRDWNPEGIIISDDDESFARDQVLDFQTDPSIGLPVAYLDPKDLHTHLSTLR